ncbi:class I adenylate-forming enzyme family protein [Capillimicrobium parvum]|uniref:Long-chain-fatty-acid--CoA ligase n=1 Tax=Capillimicrobium parvum TaxID=2884022 RepID=A0A9E6Y0Y3_9ACTN|nr:AMP-binding protein [Capillimicrobium parvum]UGS38059.1 Long-chain-fatty-acid--CoA ligase [Capillimicrobium parvum]
MSAQPASHYDPTAFREVFERRFTYIAGVERNSHRFASRFALHDPASGRRWTYASLWADAGRLAGGLRDAGVGPGDVVVFQLFNGPELALLWLAAQRLGAVASPINFRLSSGETAYVLDDSRPRAFVYDGALEPTARDALARASHEPGLVAVVGPGGGRARAFDTLLEAEPPASLPDATTYDETTRLYTSGTTGMPKGVSLSSLVEVLSAHDVIMHFPLSPEDRTLNMTPWFHRGGLYSGGPNPVFYVGAEAVALRQFDPATVLDRVAEHGLTYLIGAPTNLALLSAEQQARPRDLSTLHGIVTMGAPLDREACLRYQRLLTPRIFNGYGTTEAFWNTFLRPADLPDHAGSAGRACTDDDVAVVRIYEDRVAAPDDLAAKDGSEVGEVIVRSVKSGYAYVNQPEEQAARFRDGWLYIGDLATWDADEYVTIVGRKDDMIISGGENVHPTQVEAVLNEHPGVSDCAVVGLPDERWGEIVVAYVVRADPALDAAACEAHCLAHPMLAGYKRPRAYRFADVLPMTATGKKVHYQVRAQVEADAAAGLLERP